MRIYEYPFSQELGVEWSYDGQPAKSFLLLPIIEAMQVPENGLPP